ncbi:hypothetical protein [Marivita sp. XM-24bin2]|jgi:hypothetical protein|uniref:hypothetical protein n=1 Tax=unclassified Marivita TaxID=2632480 RepID=UPI000D7B71D7|nr:hypothetical protein [Marivita sp. XM-24bin2]MCR9110553.1 hypothetical protein [Paracoccaceae bacterium]PWL33642.1 MAG: hypothetical protein DCO97_18465 [Marivita sp. XM-24bin2]
MDDLLESAFADARQAPPSLPDGLMARVMADAEAHVPVSEVQPLWRQVVGTLGGWPAIGGLAVTACVGVWAGGALTDDLMLTVFPTEAATLDIGTGLGAFDLLLVDG